MATRLSRVRRGLLAVLRWTAPTLLAVSTLAWATSPRWHSRLSFFVPLRSPAGVAWSQYSVLAASQRLTFAHYRGLPDPQDPGGWPHPGWSCGARPVLPGWFAPAPTPLWTIEADWTSDIQQAVVPCWMVTAFFGVPSLIQAIVWYRRRARAKAGCCPKCAYSLAGLPAGAPCPECGRNNPAPTITASEPT